VLWRKLRPKLSAGRVQSVATRLVVAREEARMRFVAAGFAGLEAELDTGRPGKRSFRARLAELAGRKVASGKDFDAETGQIKNAALLVLDEPAAAALRAALEAATFRVAELTEKPFTSRPYPPFMTSTLQQEAGRKLRFNAQRTMRVAQRLYENGHITYMRTDSLTLSGEAIHAARTQIVQLYGEAFLPEHPRHYRSKSKSAQEAHEAIRPAGDRFRTPESLHGELDADEYRLYELIWMRTLASQMKDATGLRSSVRVEAAAGAHGPAIFTASGKLITFAGFLRAYVEGSDDPEAEMADEERPLPRLETGQALEARALEVTVHTTQPPARYTEASLVKELESRGIGRPSTYATIIQTIQDRDYVWRKGQALVPTFTAFAVTRLLERQLPDLVDYDFTARMEDELDAIARGDRAAVPWLHDFYFGTEQGGGSRTMSEGLHRLISDANETVDPREASRILELGSTADGRQVVVRIGRYGPYIEADGQRASIPDHLPPDELTLEKALELLGSSAGGGRQLGTDDTTGQPVVLKHGRFGHYVQLGENGGDEKPKMASLWPSMSPESLTLEDALLLLSFPREIGLHPESGKPITAAAGRYGPYISCDGDNRTLPNYESLATITVEEAVRLLKQPKSRGRRAGSSSVLAELGPHPVSGATITVRTGRYGPYVSDGTVHATVPKKTDPAAVTLEAAVELLAAREDKLKSQGKDPRAPKRRKASPRRTVKKK
jgi:DNA topoisomerase I